MDLNEIAHTGGDRAPAGYLLALRAWDNGAHQERDSL